jgi:hypothetical protein
MNVALMVWQLPLSLWAACSARTDRRASADYAYVIVFTGAADEAAVADPRRALVITARP